MSDFCHRKPPEYWVSSHPIISPEMTVKTLIDKIFRRAKKEIRHKLTQNIPLNNKYKPLGVKPVIRHSTLDAEYFEINAPYLSTLSLAQQFVDDCSAYTKPVMSFQSPGDFVVTLRNGRVYCTDSSNLAIINKDNYVVDELSFQWGNHELLPTSHNGIFRIKGFAKPTVYNGTVFSLLAGGAEKYYYYHWVYDTMPKMFLLQKTGQLDKVDYFLVPSYALKFQREYLTHFGITPDRIINEQEVHHIQADYLIVTSHIRYNDHHSKWIFEFLQSSFINKYSINPAGKRIYISRGDAARNRKVHGEPQLMEMLKEFGFETYYLSTLSIQEQAQLFDSASIVVGSHGGGLSNFAFCRPGTKVLELHPDQYVRHLFYDIAVKTGLEYHYLTFPSDGSAKDSHEGQVLGLFVDVEKVREKVQLLVGSGEVALVSH